MKSFFALLFVTLTLGISTANAQASEPAAGVDYTEIPNGQPLKAAQGKIVVEEFFNYICPACDKFEPQFVAWTKQLPSYVEVAHVPATFREDFANYARVFYAAQALGVEEKTHQAIYDAIHSSHELPGEGEKFDDAKVADYYKKFGVDPKTFLATMKSFGVNTKVRMATEHLKDCKITSTPSIVINGRYLVHGKTNAETLRIAADLIRKLHAD